MNTTPQFVNACFLLLPGGGFSARRAFNPGSAVTVDVGDGAGGGFQVLLPPQVGEGASAAQMRLTPLSPKWVEAVSKWRSFE